MVLLLIASSRATLDAPETVSYKISEFFCSLLKRKRRRMNLPPVHALSYGQDALAREDLCPSSKSG